MLFSKYYFLYCYFLLALIFLFHYGVSGQAVYGDGIGYYSYLHSWYFDADNDFTNEYKHIYSQENNNALEAKISDQVQIVGTNSEGAALNHFSPGTAMLLMPFFVAADAVVQLLNLFGAHVPQNGYSDLYQIGVGLGAVGYMVAALFVSERLLGLFGSSQKQSRITTATIFFATNLVFYGAFDIVNSHFASYFLATIFFWYLFAKGSNVSSKHLFVLGCIAAMMTLTRPQDGIIFVVLLAAVEKKTLRGLLAFFLPLLAATTLLLWLWLTTFDSLIDHPYFGWMTAQQAGNVEFGFFWTLFHPTNGLFFRTPLLLLAFGFFMYLLVNKKVERRLFLLALFFGLQYLIVSMQGGWSAAAYGGRMYISSLPFFLVLIAVFFEHLGKHFSYKVQWWLISFFISLNVLSIASFVLFEKEASGATRGTEKYTYEKIIEKFERVF